MYHILVVDDEPDLDLLIQQKFRKRIKGQELKFTFCRNGYEAISALEASSDVCLVVTDYNMPKMNGIELIIQIRKRYGTLPVIIVSAYSDQDSLQAASKAGADDFLCKPLHLGELEKKIDSTLKQV